MLIYSPSSTPPSPPPFHTHTAIPPLFPYAFIPSNDQKQNQLKFEFYVLIKNKNFLSFHKPKKKKSLPINFIIHFFYIFETN